jgi:hypothetical protein
LENKNQKLEKDLSDLQTKYDMEVRSKEELLQFLSYYRQSPFIPLIASDSFFDSNNETTSPLLHEFLKSHISKYTSSNICYTVILNRSDKKGLVDLTKVYGILHPYYYDDRPSTNPG